MAFLFNHVRDWFRTVTWSSKEGMIAVLNMSHYIQRRVMFLRSITLMANPSSPAEVIHFLLSHQSLCWVEAHIIIAKWLWHRIGKNNQCWACGDYITASDLAQCTHSDASCTFPSLHLHSRVSITTWFTVQNYLILALSPAFVWNRPMFLLPTSADFLWLQRLHKQIV